MGGPSVVYGRGTAPNIFGGWGGVRMGLSFLVPQPMEAPSKIGLFLQTQKYVACNPKI